MRTLFTFLASPLIAAPVVAGPLDQPWRALPLITEGRIDSAWEQVGWGGFVV